MSSKKRRVSGAYAMVHKLAAAVTLLAFGVIAVSGFAAGSRVSSITYRALIATLVIAAVSRVVVTVFQHSEEMNRGEG